MERRLYFFSLLASIFILSGCFKTAVYDEHAYAETISLKQNMLELMDKAIQSYTSYETDVTDLLQRLDAAYESSQSRANNKVSAEQWKIMIDKNANMAAGFFAHWKSEGTLTKYFIDEAKVIIAGGFDAIIDLEKSKKKQTY